MQSNVGGVMKIRLLPSTLDRASKRGVSFTDCDVNRGIAEGSFLARIFFASPTCKSFPTLSITSFLRFCVMW